MFGVRPGKPRGWCSGWRWVQGCADAAAGDNVVGRRLQCPPAVLGVRDGAVSGRRCMGELTELPAPGTSLPLPLPLLAWPLSWPLLLFSSSLLSFLFPSSFSTLVGDTSWPLGGCLCPYEAMMGVGVLGRGVVRWLRGTCGAVRRPQCVVSLCVASW